MTSPGHIAGINVQGHIVSPSQINDAKDCLRKWGHRTLDGVKSPPHRSAAAGTAVHGILEAWLEKGAPPDTNARLMLDGREYSTGLIANGGIHHLPPPGHVLVERSFRFSHWQGRIDLAWATRGGIILPPKEINPEDPDQIPGIGDHKTTGNMAFSLDEETLRSDPQGVIYANAILEEFRRTNFVDELWIYYGTSAPFKSKKVHIRVNRDTVAAKLVPMDRLAEQLIRLKGSGLKAMDLPPSPEACENYGGCPHRQRCNLSPAQLLRGHFEQERRRQGHMPSTEEMIQQATAQANGAHVAQAQVPGKLQPMPGLILTPGWDVHPLDQSVEWCPPTGEWRKMQVAAPVPPVVQPPPVVQAPVFQAPALPPALPMPQQPPPMVVQAQVQQAQTNAMANAMLAALPPIVAVGPPPVAQIPPVVSIPPLTIGPDGLPPGSINAPEGAGLPDKLEPVAVTAATGAKDDLDLLSKEQLQQLASSMGLDVKRLREAGLRDRLRAARTAGVQPQAGAQMTMPSGTAVTSRTTPEALGAAFAAVTDEGHLNRVAQVTCALIQMLGAQTMTKQPAELVAYARVFVDAIEAE